MLTKRAACFTVLALGASGIEAAPETRALSFATTIPAPSFVIAPTGGWPAAETVIAYDAALGTFKPYVLELDVTNVNANVTAKLSAVPQLVAGTNKIPLTVTIKKVALSTKPTTIRAKAATAEKMPLEIVATPSNVPYAAGTYKGAVTIVFDAA